MPASCMDEPYIDDGLGGLNFSLEMIGHVMPEQVENLPHGLREVAKQKQARDYTSDGTSSSRRRDSPRAAASTSTNSASPSSQSQSTPPPYAAGGGRYPNDGASSSSSRAPLGAHAVPLDSTAGSAFAPRSHTVSISPPPQNGAHHGVAAFRRNNGGTRGSFSLSPLQTHPTAGQPVPPTVAAHQQQRTDTAPPHPATAIEPQSQLTAIAGPSDAASLSASRTPIATSTTTGSSSLGTYLNANSTLHQQQLQQHNGSNGPGPIRIQRQNSSHHLRASAINSGMTSPGAPMVTNAYPGQPYPHHSQRPGHPRRTVMDPSHAPGVVAGRRPSISGSPLGLTPSRTRGSSVSNGLGPANQETQSSTSPTQIIPTPQPFPFHQEVHGSRPPIAAHQNSLPSMPMYQQPIHGTTGMRPSMTSSTLAGWNHTSPSPTSASMDSNGSISASSSSTSLQHQYGHIIPQQAYSEGQGQGSSWIYPQHSLGPVTEGQMQSQHSQPWVASSTTGILYELSPQCQSSQPLFDPRLLFDTNLPMPEQQHSPLPPHNQAINSPDLSLSPHQRAGSGGLFTQPVITGSYSSRSPHHTT